ncbi:hypothetical protein [Pedobacter heparinus]|uniref:hypothetical protein n=1 Tax=Pedobacter heparinus TaxID=984 RepID=UPI0029316CA5|nr:hypothetical protein [Pedobacter heparinus]
MSKILFMSIVSLLLGAKLQAQQIPDSIKYKVQQVHYQRLLHIDNTKARKVAEIQGNHQDQVSALFGRIDLDPKAKTLKIKMLDSLRMGQLRTILDPKDLIILNKGNGSPR